MTIDEFVERLKGTNLDWKLKDDGAVRALDPLSHECHCVVTAVLQDWSVFTTPENALQDRAGFSLENSLAIVDSADNNTEHLNFSPDLRARILKACHCKERED